MNTTFQPASVSASQFAAGLVRTEGYLPPNVDSVPPESWRSVALGLFEYGTGTSSRFVPCTDIDPTDALRHVGAILRTQQLSVEDRTNSVARLLHQWFRGVTLECGVSAGVAV